jgi:hypothetical protein
MMEYRKHIETKIIRTEHHVVIWPGGSAANLKQALSPVPLNAKLLEVKQGDGSQMILIFTDEYAVQPSLDGDKSDG